MKGKKRKGKILIAGGLGFIGSHVASRLADHWDVLILDWDKTKRPSLNNKSFKIIRADVANPKVWQKIEKCDYVFHAAAQTSAVISERDPVRDFLTNAFGTFLVAEYAKKHGSKIIFCNSIRIYNSEAIEKSIEKYGEVFEDCQTVDQASIPQPPFAFSKLYGETTIRRYSQMYGLKAVSLRLSGVVGPGQMGNVNHGWLSFLLECAVRGKRFIVFGNGSQSRDILHVNDLVDLISLMVNDFDYFTDNGFSFYNIGGGKTNRLSMRDAINFLTDTHHLHMNLSYQDFRKGEPLHYVSGLEKIRQKGWQPARLDPYGIVSEMVNELVKG
ncbi:MAG: NAD-dependent epimerase/dehydratase family protein [Proteobacteria bacterium]|nr:NAD-dependent epimerase/dehydratase family protein [Pseudomonadota bacterium]